MNNYKKSLKLVAVGAIAIMGFAVLPGCNDDDNGPVGNPTFEAEGLTYKVYKDASKGIKNELTFPADYTSTVSGTDDETVCTVSFPDEYSIASGKTIEIGMQQSGYGISTQNDGMVFADAVKLLVRSNVKWRLVPEADDDWVIMLPREGRNDMKVRMSFWANDDIYPRTVNYKIEIDGKLQESTFLSVTQAPSKAYLNAAVKCMPAEGGNVTIEVNTNVPAYEARLDQNNWIAVESQTEAGITFKVEKNPDLTLRSTKLHITCAEFPEVNVDYTITQLAEGIYLNDNFDWLGAYLSTTAAACTDQLQVNPSSQEHLLGTKLQGNAKIPDAHGWQILGYNWLYTSGPSCYAIWQNADSGENFAGNGLLKIGKTNFFGDITTPVLEGIEGPKDVKIRFKAIAQWAKSLSQCDGNELCVAVLQGAGEVDEPDAEIVTMGDYKADNGVAGPAVPVKAKRLFVTKSPRYNDSSAPLDLFKDAEVFEVRIKGADSSTAISFIGGPTAGWQWPKVSKFANRIMIDEVMVCDVDRF